MDITEIFIIQTIATEDYFECSFLNKLYLAALLVCHAGQAYSIELRPIYYVYRLTNVTVGI